MQRRWRILVMVAALVAILVMVVRLVALGPVANAPKLDPEKYPQDTPQHALESLIKALDSKDYAYWMVHLMTPFDSNSLLNKHENSVEKAAAFFSVEKRAALLKDSHDLMQKMLDANKTSEGEEQGVKYARYEADGKMLQLEKEADGRWCMNTRYLGTKKEEAGPKKEEAAPKKEEAPPKKD